MRLHLKLSPNKTIVPFDYQGFLVGCFHKWLGQNNIHDEISLYSLSWLKNSVKLDKGFDFPKGASWFISFWNNEVAKSIAKGILDTPEVCCGMEVAEIIIQQNPEFRCRERFQLSSPVFIKKCDENKKTKTLTYKDNESGHYLTETLKRKMKKAGLNNNVKVCFDKTYTRPKTKLVTINNIKNVATYCPVIIEGDREAVQFAWNVGIGNSTGCGFGALC